MKRIVFLVLIAFFVPGSAWAESAYVQSVRADVYSKPAMNSTKTLTLSKGDTVTVISKKGSWSEIEHPNGKGFVYTFLLNKKPVSTREKLYSKLRSFFYNIESISNKSRRRPSSYTATAAARGFREKRKHFAEIYKSDYDSLEKFESIAISDNDALDFIQKGVLDEKNN
ncbi:MAG: SH3 domain-containing protein [Proteobacteria bacterium]|nr:SH3 domain-containing protein [Pseudomonadota bacterium]